MAEPEIVNRGRSGESDVVPGNLAEELLPGTVDVHAVKLRQDDPLAQAKNIDIAEHRNIGIIAHIDAGKTTVSERILWLTGAIKETGEVHDGQATMDSRSDEQERGITIKSAAVNVAWKDSTFTIIDTPGHVDFTAEVERSLRVLDGAVCVLDARKGVQAQTRKVWRQADKYAVPRICFLNKMDNVGADFHATVNSLETRLDAKPLPLQLPIGQGQEHEGVIDLLNMRAWRYDSLAQRTAVAIPDAMLEEAEAARLAIVEVAALHDENIFESLEEGHRIEAEQLQPVLRKLVISGEVQPVLCGAALRDIGVDELCDAVAEYFPSPADLPPTEALDANNETVELNLDPKGPLAALAFKTITEPTGTLTYLRIMSGSLEKGDTLWNSAKGRSQQMSRLLLVKADTRIPVESAQAGQIVAVAGLNNTDTGETICKKDAPLFLESISFSDPLVVRSIEPEHSSDAEILEKLLESIARDDPSFKFSRSKETGQLIMHGMGELHLEIITNRIKEESRLNVRVGQDRVSYRQALNATSTIEYEHDFEFADRKEYAKVEIRFEPTSGSDVEVENLIDRRSLPNQFIAALEEGVQQAFKEGDRIGYPFTGVKATLISGEARTGESTPTAFETAARDAFRAAIKEAGSTLLEPLVEMRVEVPVEQYGNVNKVVSTHGGQIEDSSDVDHRTVELVAKMPLAKVIGSFDTRLKSATGGTASYSMEPSGYAPAQQQDVY